MVKYYADRAQEYELIYSKPERQEELKRLRTWVERKFANACVFELACGTGYWTEVVARTAAFVLATDINEEVLAIARAKPLDRQKVSFQRADAYRLPLFSEPFNAGLAAFWWSHVPKAELPNFLCGFHRLFAPGSTIVFIDNIYVAGSNTPISRADQFGNTYQHRTLDDGSCHEVLKNFPTEHELRAAVTALASDVQIEWRRYYWILSYKLPEVES